MSEVKDKALFVVKDSLDSSKAAQDKSGPFGDSVLQGADGRGAREDLQGEPDKERIERRLSEINASIAKLTREKLQLLQARVTREAKRPSSEEKVALAKEHEIVGERRVDVKPLRVKPPKPPVEEEVADGKPAEPEAEGLGS